MSITAGPDTPNQVTLFGGALAGTFTQGGWESERMQQPHATVEGAGRR